MKRYLRNALVLLFGFGMSVSVLAQNNNSAEGYWQTRDDVTHKPSSVIHIYKKGAEWIGQTSHIYVEGKQKSSDICTACHGSQHNKPMLGLVIISHMKEVGAGRYKNGYVLDPRDGKIYHAQMTVADHGRVLKLRGYVGAPMFGKTTQWYRIQNGTK